MMNLDLCQSIIVLSNDYISLNNRPIRKPDENFEEPHFLKYDSKKWHYLTLDPVTKVCQIKKMALLSQEIKQFTKNVLLNQAA